MCDQGTAKQLASACKVDPIFNKFALKLRRNAVYRSTIARAGVVNRIFMANIGNSNHSSVLDRLDRRLLQELQQDARLTNQALANAVGLSESACLRRVRRLESSGLIERYVALLDPATLGYPGTVFVQITLQRQQQENLQAFEAAVQQLPEVMECHLMSGSSDYLLRVVVADARDYERLHSQHLTRLPGVDQVHSNFALRSVVQTTALPLTQRDP